MKNSVYAQQDAHFGKVVHADIQRSTFLRNSGKKTTLNAGELVPVYIDEILPGDTFDMKMSFISRMTTPIFPTMDNLDLDFYAFYTPTRLLWNGWEQLNGENKSSAWVPSTAPALVPFLVASPATVESGSVADYLDIPVGTDTSKVSLSELPFRNYHLIWNEWFRDQNLQAPIPISIGGSGGLNRSVTVAASLLKAAKKHDYFTSALPAPQKGESQLIPIELNELIPVLSMSGSHTESPWWFTGKDIAGLEVASRIEDTSLPTGNLNLVKKTELDANKSSLRFSTDAGTPNNTDAGVVYPSNLWADGRGINISGSTISELRTAFQLQKLYEKDARGGTRYVEMLKAHFGVEAQDYRLQRPEFLGKITSTVGIHQVAQTSSTDETSPQGNVSAFAYGSGTGRIFNKSFVEHGYLMILACARQRKTYQQGIDKLWFRRDRFDFYYPTLANISEQPILNKEIFISNSETDDEVFGYQEAWADYRYKLSKVSGKMRSGLDDSFDAYHYADYYESRPTLSAEWIAENSKDNVDRTLAVSSTLADQIILDIAFDCKATRPMPIYSIPGMVDHF